MGVGNLAANPGNQEKIVEEGALTPLIGLARFDNGDIDSQRYAIIALANVAANPATHEALIEAGVVRLMCNMMQSDDVEVRCREWEVGGGKPVCWGGVRSRARARVREIVGVCVR